MQSGFELFIYLCLVAYIWVVFLCFISLYSRKQNGQDSEAQSNLETVVEETDGITRL